MENEIFCAIYTKGFDSYFGKGKTIYPWIHIDDLCGMIIFEIENEHVNGAYNAAAPNAIIQKEMNKAIEKELGKRFFLSLFLYLCSD